MEIFLINLAATNFKSFTEGSLKGDIKFFIAIIIAYLGLSLTHLQLGADPFFWKSTEAYFGKIISRLHKVKFLGDNKAHCR